MHSYLYQPSSQSVDSSASSSHGTNYSHQYVAAPVHYTNFGSPLKSLEPMMPANPNSVYWNNPVVQQPLSSTKRKFPKKAKIVQSAWCEVCKIDCNSSDVLNRHLSGKKHKRNLEQLTGVNSSTNNTLPTAPIVHNKFARCEVCQIDCNSSDVLNRHLLGKKHKKNLEQLSVVNLSTNFTSPTGGIVHNKPTWCEVCQIDCNSSDVLNRHILGKKHKTNLEQLTGDIWSINVTPPTASVVHYRTSSEDLETKKRNIVEGGAAIEYIQMCEICNVVCNSDVVFHYHLHGHKHAAMVKEHTTSMATPIAPAVPAD